MVRSWVLNGNSSVDQRDPRMTEPVQLVDIADLAKIGVDYYKFDAATYDSNEDFKKLREERGFSYQDVITVSKDTLPNYEEKLKVFYQEHLHEDEEVRYFIEGSGYFDVRDANDKWIRIELEKDDLIVLPSGIYHRFTLDKNNYAKVMRLFVGEPVWTPFNRPCDEKTQRKQYLQKFISVN